MHITLAAAMSLDGRIKKQGGVHTREWISKEDKELFAQFIAKGQVIIAGRKTYCNMRPVLHKDKRYVILTHSPDHYAAESVTGHIEFTDDEPAKIVGRLADQGYENVLLTGGGLVSGAFLAAGLVDEVFMTIEPLMHGLGTSVVDGQLLNVRLRLLSVEQLNAKGTLLLRYQVAKRVR